MRLFNMIKPVTIILFSIILLATFIGEAHALTIEMSFEDITAKSESIIIGRVKSIESYWNEKRTNIYTEVTVSVEDNLKGAKKQDEIIIIIPGGEVNGITQYVSDTPAFKPGETAMLFLNELPHQNIFRQKHHPKLYQVTGNAQGKIHIQDAEVKDPTINEQEEKLDDGAEEYSHTTQSGFVYNGFCWPGSYPIVNYYVNASSARNAQVQTAADTWSNAGANFSFNYAGTHSRVGKASMNGINEIMWYDLGTNYALAVATIWFSGDRILENDMVFNTRYNWSTTIPAPHGYYDVQTVALHEFGHWFSLGHSPIFEAIMYYQVKGVQRYLHSADIAGIQYIYGAKDLQPEEYFISISTNPDEGGSFSGGGNYDHGQEANLNATANAGYTFINWTEDDEVVCSDPDYFFIAEANRNLVANFEVLLQPPAPPVLRSPALGEFVVGTSVDLEWEASRGATHYNVWVFNLSTGQELYYELVPGDTIFTVEGLPDNGEFIGWSVVAGDVNTGLWGDFAIPRIFKSGTDKILIPPTLTSPEDGTNVPGTSVELEWETSPGAEAYNVAILNNTTGELFDYIQLVIGTSVIVEGLPDNGDTFLWTVVAGAVADGWSDFAFPRTFVNE